VTAPLTDEQVSDLAAADSDCDECVPDECFDAAVAVLAREVQAYRALRPDCPTCEGAGCDLDFCRDCGDEYTDPCIRHAGCSVQCDKCCPDCTDGKMPLDKWVALLVETLAAARSDMEGWAAYASDYFTAKHNLAGDLASVDAVLKMVPKVAE